MLCHYEDYCTVLCIFSHRSCSATMCVKKITTSISKKFLNNFIRFNKDLTKTFWFAWVRHAIQYNHVHKPISTTPGCYVIMKAQLHCNSCILMWVTQCNNVCKNFPQQPIDFMQLLINYCSSTIVLSHYNYRKKCLLFLCIA